MPSAGRIASALYAAVGLALLSLGLRYLLASEFATYHAAVVETAWDDLDAPHRRLLLGLLRGFGAGLLGVGLALLLLAFVAIRSGGALVFAVMAAIAIPYTALLAWLTRAALLPGARPIAISTGLCVLAAAAALASLRIGIRRA